MAAAAAAARHQTQTPSGRLCCQAEGSSHLHTSKEEETEGFFFFSICFFPRKKLLRWCKQLLKPWWFTAFYCVLQRERQRLILFSGFRILEPFFLKKTTSTRANGRLLKREQKKKILLFNKMNLSAGHKIKFLESRWTTPPDPPTPPCTRFLHFLFPPSRTRMCLSTQRSGAEKGRRQEN